MVKPIRHSHTLDLTDSIDFAPKRRVFAQPQMSSMVVVIVNVVFQNSPQAVFVHDDQVIEAFSPDTSDHSFDVTVLPG